MSNFASTKRYNMINKDTICAMATATGGALGVIRISGEKTIKIVNSIFSKELSNAKSHTIHYGMITGDDGMMIDEVVVSLFKSPHSYTGEESAEISCHGSTYIIHQIISLLIHHGCRMAEPGEFTKRAFLNGKLDLSQAEAVADLIASSNKANHQIAISQLKGSISNELAVLRDKLLHLTSLMELELDFSDHEDLQFADRTELLQLAQTIEERISRLANTFETGQALKQGIPVAIIGKTNVGKSTLLNRLVGEERAIVSDIHGTTRDTIEDTIDIKGVTFRFIDTAGIRQTQDTVEMIGIKRTYQSMEKARIIIWLTDQQPTDEERDIIMTRCQGKALIWARNKIDLTNEVTESGNLPHPNDNLYHIAISAKHNTHINELKELIFQAAKLETLDGDCAIVTSARHYNILCTALDDIRRVVSGMREGLSSDLVAEDLRLVINNLSEITGGTITTDEVLGNIFQHFCVGK